MTTAQSAADRNVWRIDAGSPAWAPQQMLADDTRCKSSRSLLQPSPRSAFRSMARPGDSVRDSKLLITPGLEFPQLDWLKLDPVAGPDGEETVFSVGDPQRRAAQQVPATRRFARIDTGLASRDRHRA